MTAQNFISALSRDCDGEPTNALAVQWNIGVQSSAVVSVDRCRYIFASKLSSPSKECYNQGNRTSKWTAEQGVVDTHVQAHSQA